MLQDQESSNKRFADRLGRNTNSEFIKHLKEGSRVEKEVLEEEDSLFGLAIGNTQAISFRVDFESGEQYFIQYHELISPLKFNGSSEILLETPYLLIKIIGRNLNQIFEYLGHHRLGWLKEPDGDWMKMHINDLDNKKPAIKEIKIQDKE